MGDMADYYLERAMEFDEEELYVVGSIYSERLEKKIWTTKDGITIPIKDMSDQHIINTLSYISKGARIYGYAEEWADILKEECITRGIDNESKD